MMDGHLVIFKCHFDSGRHAVKLEIFCFQLQCFSHNAVCKAILTLPVQLICKGIDIGQIARLGFIGLVKQMERFACITTG